MFSYKRYMPHKSAYKIVLLMSLLLGAVQGYATHNRAGEITYRKLDRLKYEFTLTLYTELTNPNNTNDPKAVNDDAILSFGDGTTDTAKFDFSAVVAPFIEKRTYHYIHSYTGVDTFTISFKDENRNEKVLNMTNSVATSFYIETFLKISPQSGFNSSPVLLLPPIDFGNIGQLFLHSPNPYDADGDSLAFKLVACKQDVNVEVGNYLFLNENGFSSNFFGIDATTGEVRWDAPTTAGWNQTTTEGIYNIAIQIEEWRDGILLGYIIRDMQIIIKNVQNTPPIITPIANVCVLAGNTVQHNVTAIDNEPDDSFTNITLSATGGPFEVSPAATFETTSTESPTTQQFTWQPICDLVRNEPYQVVYKAVDNGTPPLVGLETVQITVIAPAPTNLTATANGSTINLKWDAPIPCTSKALGYKIYRRSGSYAFTPSGCNTGIPEQGKYTLIKTIKDKTLTAFTDNNNGLGLKPGSNYCYRIVLYYADKAESYASNEACTELKRDVPVITNVDVFSTSSTAGSIYVEWMKPAKTTIENTSIQSPYIYHLYRATHKPQNLPTDFKLVKSDTSNLYVLSDTTFTDVLLNTEDFQFTYKVEFYAQIGDKTFTEFVSTSQLASSLFITLSPGDNKVRITLDEEVPWENATYTVLRKNTTGIFEPIAVNVSASYIDENLTNSENGGSEKCYKILTSGDYSATGYKSPLLNNSQESCTSPTDNEPPCAPILTVVDNCINFTNNLTWTLDSTEAICRKEIVAYNVYRSDFLESEPQLIATINDKSAPDMYNALALLLVDLKQSIAGCFTIEAVDSVQQKTLSNKVCVDNCPNYFLPNVFTPNGDGINDILTPFPDSKFNQDVRFYVYDRWGVLVFETTNKDINWDGTHYQSKKKLPGGTYYYVCYVNEIKVAGITPRAIKGFITIIPD